MITIDLTMPIQIINMLLLIVILNSILYRPIRAIIEERRRKIDGLSGDVEKFNKNAKLRVEEFDRKIREARTRAKGEFETSRQAGQAVVSDKLGQLRKEVEAAKGEQLRQIEQQFAAARGELKGQVNAFAGEMAGKVLGRNL